MKMLKNKGITLIALIITIIILLILAGITIGTLTGDNSLINQAGEAKEETEIASEKEVIEKATVEAMGKNKYGNIEEEQLQEAMDGETGDGKTEVESVGEEFEVLFIESNRYYIVDENGTIKEYEIAVTDPYPGDITKDENGNTLDGEDKPYQINCIEDLMEWSQNYTKYQNSNIDLCRDLNFESKFSYKDSETKVYLDVNQDGTEEGLRTELTKKDSNCQGFPPIHIFGGSFDGKEHEIKNIYINKNEGDIGFFRVSRNVKISNLTISGEISGVSKVGAFVRRG